MIIGYFVENYRKGGVNTFLQNLFAKKKSANQIYLITNKNNPGLDIIKKKNVKIVYYSIFSWDSIFNKYENIYLLFIFKLFYSLFFPVTFLYQSLKLYSALKKIKLDKMMIVNGGYPGGDLCLAAVFVWSKIYPNNRVWMNFHNFALSNYKSPLLNFYKNLIDKLILNLIEGFISVSKISTASIKKRKYLKKVNRFTIYNGHSFKKENKKINLKKKFNLPKKAKILLMLAEYDLRKGHDYIIKVMEKIVKKDKNIFLFIFGDGNKKLVQQLLENSSVSKNIFLKNFEKKKFSLIQQSDIIVIPSQKFESFGYTAIEAMSLKKAVVATDFGGVKEIILNGKTGFLVNKNKPEFFAKRVLKLLNDKKLKKRIENKSYLHYKNFFTSERMIKNYNQILKR